MINNQRRVGFFWPILHLTTNNIRYYIPLDLLIVVITLGIVLGAVSFGLAALRTLKMIEKKGMFSQSLSELLFIISIAVILIGALFFVFASSPFQSFIFSTFCTRCFMHPNSTNIALLALGTEKYEINLGIKWLQWKTVRLPFIIDTQKQRITI